MKINEHLFNGFKVLVSKDIEFLLNTSQVLAFKTIKYNFNILQIFLLGVNEHFFNNLKIIVLKTTEVWFNILLILPLEILAARLVRPRIEKGINGFLNKVSAEINEHIITIYQMSTVSGS